MTRKTLLSALAVLATAAISPVHAQDETAADPAAPLAGHSYHGEVFNEGPRQRAYLMGTTGAVSFPVTTSSAEAQAFFDQGIGQLHGFWYFEAERSFRQVAALDPDCAMAYWGMAMANWDNRKRARGFAEEALERKEGASRRERLWIDALARYVGAGEKDETDEKRDDGEQRNERRSRSRDKSRRQRYVRDLEGIINDFPDDVEAKAFLAVSLWHFKGDLPIVSHQAIDSLLDQVFDASPTHPAHHYRIHLWDYERPERALPSAARCGQAAPGIAHMWHMSGHIFSRLKRYADAAWQQEASARVDHAHMVRDRVLPDQIHNYAHNNEWLIRDLSHVGRVHDAIDLARNMIELPRHPEYNTLDRRGRSASYGRQRLFELLERFELWEDAIALSRTVYLEPTDLEREQLKRLRLLGVAWSELGDDAQLAKQTAEVDRRLADLRGEREDAIARACEKARAEAGDGDSGEALEKARKEAARPFDDRIREHEKVLDELGACGALLAGDLERAREALKEVKGVERERMARLWLRAGDLEAAERLAREAVDSDDRQVARLATYVDVLERAGKRDEAAKAFERLRELSSSIDLDAPLFRRLEPLALELAGAADWRVAPVPAGDVGERPELDALGPFRWQPPPAPAWSLEDAAGTRISLGDYRGKPVVVIFYLGFGCLHCVEQLESFAPKVEEYAREGMSLVAISTENREELGAAIESFVSDGKRIPFPLVANPELDVFKLYRAFDDFENQPLHGTFLISPAGAVLWQDISYEPFTKPDWLLREAKRLLGLRRGAVGYF